MPDVNSLSMYPKIDRAIDRSPGLQVTYPENKNTQKVNWGGQASDSALNTSPQESENRLDIDPRSSPQCPVRQVVCVGRHSENRIVYEEMIGHSRDPGFPPVGRVRKQILTVAFR